jgi:hypothetical protein
MCGCALFVWQRLRMFPSLVNCCTIDWFTEWPQQALRSVAVHFLDSVEMDPKVSQSCKSSQLGYRTALVPP